MIAADKGHCEIAKFLISVGVSVDFERLDSTALILASQNCNNEMILLLIEAGANVNRAGSSGPTPLICAASTGDVTVVRNLIERGADVNLQSMSDSTTPLIEATREGYPDVVRELLSAGANIDGTGDDGMAPLHLAAQNDHAEIVAVLIEFKANVNQTSKTGLTPLLYAAKKGHFRVVKELIAAGADVSLKRDGQTPLDIACLRGHSGVVEVLIKSPKCASGGRILQNRLAQKVLADAAINVGFDPDTIILNGNQTVLSRTLFRNAAENGFHEIVEVIQPHVDVNDVFRVRLHEKWVELTAHWKERGWDTTTMSIDATPLWIAAAHGHVRVVDVLLGNRSTNVNYSVREMSPLWVACALGHIGVVEALLRVNAEIGDIAAGTSALNAAIHGGHTEIIPMLTGFLGYHFEVGEIPQNLCCGVMQRLMLDPVNARTGNGTAYDRWAMEKWFRQSFMKGDAHPADPMTNLPV
jgi:ankyrin repeat protein